MSLIQRRNKGARMLLTRAVDSYVLLPQPFRSFIIFDSHTSSCQADPSAQFSCALGIHTGTPKVLLCCKWKCPVSLAQTHPSEEEEGGLQCPAAVRSACPVNPGVKATLSEGGSWVLILRSCPVRAGTELGATSSWKWRAGSLSCSALGLGG